MVAAWKVPLARRAIQPLMRQGRAARLPILNGPAAGLSFSAANAPLVYASGRVEPEVQEVFVREISEGGTVYDVGANVGFYTLLAARTVGPTGAVVAFEPNSDNGIGLRGNVEANGFDNVTLVPRAVSSTSGAGVLDVSAPFSSYVVEGSDEPDVSAHTLLITLDDFVEEHPELRPDLVKIDVEGHELAVLAGMNSVLITLRPKLIVELHHKSNRSIMGDIQEFLRERRYKLIQIEADVERATSPGWGLQHVLALPDEPARLVDASTPRHT